MCRIILEIYLAQDCKALTPAFLCRKNAGTSSASDCIKKRVFLEYCGDIIEKYDNTTKSYE